MKPIWRTPIQTLSLAALLSPATAPLVVILGLVAVSILSSWHSSVAGFEIVIDYSFDSAVLEDGAVSGFFNPSYTYADGSTGLDRRIRMERAAAIVASNISDELLPVLPGPDDTLVIRFANPKDGGGHTILNPVLPADTIIIYAGGRNIGGATLGLGGMGYVDVTWGSPEFIDAGQHRGEGPSGSMGQPADEYGPWGGSVAFNTEIVVEFEGAPTNFDWHFGETTEGLDLHYDFLTVAIHEIGHVMGFGTAESFDRYIDVGGTPLGADNSFIGPQAMAVWGGPVPLEGDSSFPLRSPSHWLAGLDEDSTVMDTTLRLGRRASMQSVDWAALADIGWDVVLIPEPSGVGLLTLGLAGMMLSASNRKPSR